MDNLATSAKKRGGPVHKPSARFLDGPADALWRAFGFGGQNIALIIKKFKE